MPPRSKDTPRERYKSVPLTEKERHDLPIKLGDALASGPSIVVDPGLNLTMRLLGASIKDDGDIHASIVVEGYVRRPDRTAKATGVSIPVTIPAEIVEEDTS